MYRCLYTNICLIIISYVTETSCQDYICGILNINRPFWLLLECIKCNMEDVKNTDSSFGLVMCDKSD